MKPFEHVDATSIEEAISFLDRDWDARIIAGGTDLLGEMKANIIRPTRLVNIKTVPGLVSIEDAGEAGLTVGPLVTLTTLEEDETIQRRIPILSQAASEAASPQLRNMGSLAGNLCQRPRCWYYRNDEFPCLRKGGPKCFAVGGDNRYHAILGGGPCFIVHPSDTAPALMALDAWVAIAGADGCRSVPLEDFFVLPREDPHHENMLRPDQLITQVTVPAPDPGARGIYLKARERQSWAFALVSVAAQLSLEGKHCHKARIVLGGVAPAPWRARDAEAELEGVEIDDAAIERAAEAAVAGARPMRDNGYKIPMARNLVKRAIAQLAGGHSSA